MTAQRFSDSVRGIKFRVLMVGPRITQILIPDLRMEFFVGPSPLLCWCCCVERDRGNTSERDKRIPWWREVLDIVRSRLFIKRHTCEKYLRYGVNRKKNYSIKKLNQEIEAAHQQKPDNVKEVFKILSLQRAKTILNLKKKENNSLQLFSLFLSKKLNNLWFTFKYHILMWIPFKYQKLKTLKYLKLIVWFWWICLPLTRNPECYC